MAFFTKFENRFSPERGLRLPQSKLFSSNLIRVLKTLLFWSYGFGFEIFGSPPTCTRALPLIYQQIY